MGRVFCYESGLDRSDVWRCRLGMQRGVLARRRGILAGHWRRSEVLPRRLYRGSRHLGALPRDLDRLPGYLDSLPAHLDRLPVHLDSLPGYLGTLPGYLGTLPGHLDSLPNHLDSLPGNLDSLTGYLDSLSVHFDKSPINSRRIGNNGDRNHAVIFLLELRQNADIRFRMNLARAATWIQSQVDIDDATARKFANIIGDTPEVDEKGLTVVKDLHTGKVIARLKLKWK
jgi:hypothetical protein